MSEFAYLRLRNASRTTQVLERMGKFFRCDERALRSDRVRSRAARQGTSSATLTHQLVRKILATWRSSELQKIASIRTTSWSRCIRRPECCAPTSVVRYSLTSVYTYPRAGNVVTKNRAMKKISRALSETDSMQLIIESRIPFNRQRHNGLVTVRSRNVHFQSPATTIELLLIRRIRPAVRDRGGLGRP